MLCLQKNTYCGGDIAARVAADIVRMALTALPVVLKKQNHEPGQR
jgi:hypothetical protein